MRLGTLGSVELGWWELITDGEMNSSIKYSHSVGAGLLVGVVLRDAQERSSILEY